MYRTCILCLSYICNYGVRVVLLCCVIGLNAVLRIRKDTTAWCTPSSLGSLQTMNSFPPPVNVLPLSLPPDAVLVRSLVAMHLTGSTARGLWRLVEIEAYGGWLRLRPMEVG